MTICNLDGVNLLRQEFMENKCEALPGVAYPGVRDNRSTLNTKTGYDDDDEWPFTILNLQNLNFHHMVILKRKMRI